MNEQNSEIVVVEKMGRQGDVIFARVDELPADAQKVEWNEIIAHSETGHHHVARSERGPMERYSVATDPMTSYLVGSDIDIVHLRGFDTHKTIRLRGGAGGTRTVWKVRRQREHTPEGWRQVAD